MPSKECKKRFILVASNVAGLFFYLLDVVSDVLNASLYMRYKTHYAEGMATLVFVFLPILVQLMLAALSLKVSRSYEGTGSRLLSVQWLSKPNTKTIVIHFILMATLMEPVYSTYEVIRRGWKSSTRKELDDIAYKRKAERIIESIFESIPQTALQLLITGHEPYMSGLQTISIITSLFNLSYTLVTLDMERIAQERSSKRKMLKKKWQIYWFFKDHLWCIFGGIPLIISSMLSVSLFAPIYSYFALAFYAVVAALFVTRWWWWSPDARQKFFHPIIQGIISLVSLSTKLLFAILMILWYVRMKMYQETFLQTPVPAGIPPIIWPNTFNLLRKVATPAHLNDSTPIWADCDRTTMLRNGTFIIDFPTWFKGGSWDENAKAFILSSKLLCLSDLSNTLFCLVFYCIVIWTFWDVMRFIYRISSPPRKNDKGAPQKSYAIDYKLSPAQESPTELFADGFAMLRAPEKREDNHNLIRMVRIK